MPRYSALWLQIALEQFDALPVAVQRLVDARIEELLERPEGPREAFSADFHAASSTLVSGELVAESSVAPPGTVTVGSSAWRSTGE